MSLLPKFEFQGGTAAKPANPAKERPIVSSFSGFSRAAPPKSQTGPTPELVEAFNERAAIREYEGGQDRLTAEREAARELGVYRYRVTDDPTAWPYMIAPGLTLDEARADLESRYGARLLDVEAWQPNTNHSP